jgi:enoyl-[acyl-carrier protein] reductase II
LTIGAGSMYPEVLREHISKCKSHSNFENVPMLYPNIEEIMNIMLKKAKIVFTRLEIQTWTSYLKENGITVVHVVSSSVFA